MFPEQGRIKQQNLIPNAVKGRNLGRVIQETATGTASITLSNGQETTFTITTQSINRGVLLFCIPDITLFVGSVALGNALPGGANVTSSAYQVVFLGNDWGSTDDNNVVTKVFVRNVSAGTQTIILKTQSRVITNTAL